MVILWFLLQNEKNPGFLGFRPGTRPVIQTPKNGRFWVTSRACQRSAAGCGFRWGGMILFLTRRFTVCLIISTCRPRLRLSHTYTRVLVLLRRTPARLDASATLALLPTLDDRDGHRVPRDTVIPSCRVLPTVPLEGTRASSRSSAPSRRMVWTSPRGGCMFCVSRPGALRGTLAGSPLLRALRARSG